MTEKEISGKLDEIEEILGKYNILLDFCDETPDPVIYKYVVEDMIRNEKVEDSVIPGSFLHFTGCTGECSECFQKDYCQEVQEE